MAGQLQVSFSPIIVILLIIFVALFAIYVYQHGMITTSTKKGEGFQEEVPQQNTAKQPKQPMQPMQQMQPMQPMQSK